MLSRRRATAVVSANWWDGGRLEHLVGPLAPYTYVALALHTPWGSALHCFGSAHSMALRTLPSLWLCALHGPRTLPMALALRTPWAPHTSHGFWSAHSMGSAHFPRLLLCTLHGRRTLPMAFDLHAPGVPYTSTMALACTLHGLRTLPSPLLRRSKTPHYPNRLSILRLPSSRGPTPC